MVLADLTNTILSNYGNATGAAFDLTDMANLAEMEVEGANVTSEGVNSKSTLGNTIRLNVTTNTIIVNEADYQTAQYLANNTILQLFNDVLKPLTATTAGTSGTTGGNNNVNGATVQQQVDNDTLSNGGNNATAEIEKLEMSLLQLRDYVNSKANPREVMTIAHLEIHPMLMQLYGLTPEDEEV
jgi:hypothetical protein